jgi:hypothetical protein
LDRIRRLAALSEELYCYYSQSDIAKIKRIKDAVKILKINNIAVADYLKYLHLV